MTTTDLGNTAQALVAGGKGILAADETVPTVTRRLDALKIESTPESRRAYREMFFTTPEIAEFISGVIVEPEVLMDGSHTIEHCEKVTGDVLHVVFNALFDQKVSLEGMLLKPNMVISGTKCAKQASVKEVALATVRCLSRHVPAAVPGIVFLSGGQNHLVATEHLSAINQLAGPKPWRLSFSYGRALQDEALKAWHGKNENLKAGQRVFYHRAKCDSAAALVKYTNAMEGELAVA